MHLFNETAHSDNLNVVLIAALLGFGVTLNADGSIASVDGPTFGTIAVDPSAGAGVAANLGSVRMRRDAGNVQLWQKTDVLDTDWTQLGNLAGAVTLTGITTTATADFDWDIDPASATAWSIDAGGVSQLAIDTATNTVIVNAAGGLRINDTFALRFGTPGTDILITSDGTDAVLTGTGDFVVGDAVNFAIGTGKDVQLTGDGTNVVLNGGAGAGLLLAHDDVFIIADPADTTKRARLDVVGVTAGQTRVITVPDNDLNLRGVGRTIADVGDGAAIPVTTSLSMPITSGGAGETNTLAIPTFQGQRVTLYMDVFGGGDRVVTAASAINIAGNTKMTFGAARDFITLRGIQLAGALAWEVESNTLVALS